MLADLVYNDRLIEGSALDALALRAAASFERDGVEEGDRVALLLRNCPEFIAAQLGARMLGAYVVPLNWHFRADEFQFVLEDSAAKILVAHSDLLDGLEQGTGASARVVEVPVDREASIAAADGGNVDAVKRTSPEWTQWLAPSGWQGSPRMPRIAMGYTSGTTGRPKGVRRDPVTPQHSERIARLYQEVLGIERGARTLVSAPLYHGAPNLQMMGTLQQGSLLVLEPRFDAERTLALIQRYRISHAYFVPTMFVRLLRLPREVRERYDVRSLRFALHTAAPCPVDVKRSMIDWLGPVIHEFYGSNESGIVAACNSHEWLEHPGTVGRPVQGATVEVLDDAGRALPAGNVGTLYVRQEAYPDFTYHGQEQKREEIARGKLFTLGDVGYRDADGYVYIVDRRTDMVISGGVNIYPAEIERVLLALDGVRDCAVIGIPDAEFGESLAAYVQAAPGITEVAVRKHLCERLAGYKLPRVIELNHPLPRDDSGKIFKRRLKDRWWAHAGRRI